MKLTYPGEHVVTAIKPKYSQIDIRSAIPKLPISKLIINYPFLLLLNLSGRNLILGKVSDGSLRRLHQFRKVMCV